VPVRRWTFTLYFGKDKTDHRPIIVKVAITPVKAVLANKQFLSRSSRSDIILMFICGTPGRQLNGERFERHLVNNLRRRIYI
jgi:hypothetical protein